MYISAIQCQSRRKQAGACITMLRIFLCFSTFVTLSLSYVAADDYKSSLTFVIDDTFSMSDDIEQVIIGANAIFDTVLNHNRSQIENFILVTFNDYGDDPGVNLRANTKIREVFKTALNSIDVDGGGDCPEYSMAGIKKGLEKSLPGSYIYVFTDATAKDYKDFEEVKSIATKKMCQIVFVLTGDCNLPAHAPDYQVYYVLAKATAGQVFNLEKQEVGKVLEFVKNSIKGRETILGDATFPPGKNSLNVTTDTKMKDSTLSITSVHAVKPLVDIEAPDGSKPTKEVLIETDKILVYSVNMTKPGVHTVKVYSPSETRVKVTARSDIDFRHGFSTFMPSSIKSTSTKPVSGVKSHLAIKLIEGDIELKEVKILDMSGNTIQELPLELTNKKTKFYTTDAFDPPNTMFQIAIVGYDPVTNSTIRRKALTPIEPQKIIPGVTIKPESPTVVIEGDAKIYTKLDAKVQLICDVNGYPKPNIVWINKENGTILPGTVNDKELPYNYTNILVIEKANVNATYEYECQASNPSGFDSKSVTVETEPEMYFTVLDKRLSKLNIEYGKEGTIQCLVDAYPPAVITWYKDGSLLQSDDNIKIAADNSTVTMKNTKPSDKGKYMCEVRNENERRLLYKHVTVVGIEVPVIDKSITDVHVKRGSSVDIDCKLVQGIPKPSIRWFYGSGTTLEELLYLPELDDKESIKVSSAAKSNSGTYQCQARNDVGKDNHEVTVNFEYPPEIEKDVEYLKVKTGSDILINCKVDGGPTPNVTWLKNGVEVTSNDKIKIFGTGNKVTLRLTAENISDGGLYSCKATNRFGTAVRTVKVDMSVPVTITPPKESNLDVLVGSQISLPCEAHGIPKPNIRWVYTSFNKTSPSMKIVKTKDERRLNLGRIQVHEEGYYSCIASNDREVKNITYRVQVSAPPIIENTYVDKRFVAVEGDRALRISCKASGNPEPKITWMKDGRNIALGITYFVVDSTLIINDVPNDAKGFYTCRAQNSKGSDQEVFEVSVEKFPPPRRPTSSILVKQGKSTEIKCDLPHSKIDQLRWYKNGVLIRNGELTLTNPSMSDAGHYTCRVGDFIKSVNKDVRIDVGHKPEFTSVEEENIEMVEGPVVLVCDANGSPIPSVIWYQDGKRVNITEINWYFPSGIRNPGQYTCEVRNAFGSISRTYNVVPRDCFINTKKLTNLQPLMLSSNLTWPIFEKMNDFIILLKGEQLTLFCPKGFKTFPSQYLTAFCDGGTKIIVNGNKYDYENIECTEEVKHEVHNTGETCMPGNTEKLKIGYKVFRNHPTSVYEICLDKNNNVPLYAMHSMQSSFANEDISIKTDSDSDQFRMDFETAYDCESQTKTISAWLGKPFHINDRCCFTKRQLVNPKDVAPGVAQKATYSYLNIVPHWGTCNTKNWDDIEERVRNFAKNSYTEVLVWTGTAQELFMPSVYAPGTTKYFFTDIRGNRQPVPLFMWKVVQDPATRSSLAIIQVNVPDLKPSEVFKYIRCGDLCGRTEWMKSSHWHDVNRGYTYCCSLPDFEKAFGFKGVFNPGMTEVLTSDASILPETYSLAII